MHDTEEAVAQNLQLHMCADVWQCMAETANNGAYTVTDTHSSAVF